MVSSAQNFDRLLPPFLSRWSARRSIGVITKIDIMDQGTDAVKMLLDLKKNCVFLFEGLHIAFLLYGKMVRIRSAWPQHKS